MSRISLIEDPEYVYYHKLRGLPLSKNKIFGNSDFSFKMVFISGWRFNMGQVQENGVFPQISDAPVHQVILDDYYLSDSLVTQEFWTAVMGNNPSHFKHPSSPVESVSYDDCMQFSSRLNAQTGEKFRLPTEAEWEYAARGGNVSKGYRYSGSNDIESVAWYGRGFSGFPYNRRTCPIKTKAPNELGLYDMSGNVYEWCQDWYGPYPDELSVKNPKGPVTGRYKVARGGYWYNTELYCRVSYRAKFAPSERSSVVGLRLALQA